MPLLAQLRNFMVMVLLAAALISGALGEWVDAAAIVAILVLDAAMGTVQALRADNALAALRKRAAAQASAQRAGMARQVPTRALVRRHGPAGS